MNKCNKCNVNIITNTKYCPLCNSPLEENNGIDIFPSISTHYKKHNLLLNLIKVSSLIAIITCLFINYTLSKKLSWSLFVVAGITSFWLTLITALKTKKSFIKMLFVEMLVILLMSYAWDYFTGYHKWCMNYCLPFLCSIYMLAILIMRLFRKRLAKEFIFYATINSFVGLVPGLLLIFDKIAVFWPTYISVILSIVILVFLVVFNHRQVKNELERRLHI